MKIAVTQYVLKRSVTVKFDDMVGLCIKKLRRLSIFKTKRGIFTTNKMIYACAKNADAFIKIWN